MIFNRLYGWLAGAVAIVLALLGIRRSGAMSEREKQEAQRAAEHAEAQGKRLDTTREAQWRRDEIANADAADIDERLRGWTRDRDD